MTIQIPIEENAGLKNSILLCPRCSLTFAIVDGIVLALQQEDDYYTNINPSRRK